MEKIKVIHDAVGHTLTVWLGDPSQEYVCEETSDEVVIMKDKLGKVIGFELLHYRPKETEQTLTVETILKTGT